MNTDKLRFEIEQLPRTSTMVADAMADLAAASEVDEAATTAPYASLSVHVDVSNANVTAVASDAVPMVASATPTLPYGARARRPSTVPPPIPPRRAARGSVAPETSTTVTTDPSGMIHAIAMGAPIPSPQPSSATSAALAEARGIDIDMSIDTALDAAAQQLARFAVRDIDALFAAEPGRELVDLVDRSVFALSANDTATVAERPSQLFQILDELDPQPT